MQIDIVSFCDGGEEVTALYVDGNLYVYGDYYHDKIDSWIEGFLGGLRHAGTSVREKGWNVSSSGFVIDVCENGNTPPGLFENLKDHLEEE